MALSSVLKKIPIKGKFLFLWGGQITVLLLMAFFAWRALSAGQDMARTIRENAAQQRLLANGRFRFTAVQGRHRALLAGAEDAAYLQEAGAAGREDEAALEAALKALEAAPDWSEAEKPKVQAAVAAARAYLAAFQSNLAQAATLPRPTRQDLGRDQVEAFRANLAELLDGQVKGTEEGLVRSLKAASDTKALLMGGGLLAILSGYLFSVYVSRQISGAADHLMDRMGALAEGDLTKRSVLSGTDELGRMGMAFNQVVDQLTRDVQAIAQASEGAASSAAELSATTDQVHRTTEDLRKAAEVQRRAVGESSASLQHMSRTMHDVLQGTRKVQELAEMSQQTSQQGTLSVDESAKAMSAIQESSDKVARITVVITDIARQTNLLSLNAAIEAAKAGAQGKGFAVVAEEVRKLAERSGAAAKEISQLIQESSARVAMGAGAVEAAGRSLGLIESTTRDNTEHIRGIARAIEEQERSTESVAQGMGETSAMVERNASATVQLAATIQETARTTEQLAQLAQELQDRIRRFRVA